jgi:thiol-disulfide isomerase/thioredoxin
MIINWKKEIKNLAITLGIFGFLYFTGLLTTLMGGLQSLVLSTGLFNPKQSSEETLPKNMDYSGALITSDNQQVLLEDFQGKTLFINIWASWCAPCRAEMPFIASLYEKVKEEENVQFLMISIDDEFEKGLKFIHQKDFNFPVFHAKYGLNSSLSSSVIPTTFIISPEGKILLKHEGMGNFDNKEILQLLLAQ